MSYNICTWSDLLFPSTNEILLGFLDCYNTDGYVDIISDPCTRKQGCILTSIYRPADAEVVVCVRCVQSDTIFIICVCYSTIGVWIIVISFAISCKCQTGSQNLNIV